MKAKILPIIVLSIFFVGATPVLAISNAAKVSPVKTTIQTPTKKIPVVVEPAVKKSTSGICHAKGTRYYDQTKNYKAYTSIKNCLASGGRLPKN